MSGAQDVAETYGLAILELRKPNERDISGRVTKIIIDARARMPYHVLYDSKVTSCKVL